MWSLWLSFVLPYYGISFFFWIVDTYTIFTEMRYKYMAKDKIKKQYLSILPQVVFNTLCLLPFLMYISSWVVPIDYNPLYSGRCVYSLLIYVLAYEISFYYFHRLLHTRILYQYIHYKHHELTSTLALGGVYSHWLEFIFGNYIPASLGIFILTIAQYFPTVRVILPPPHYYTIILWNIMAAISVSLSHSGYFGSHIQHHVYYLYNFGTLGFMDYFHDTKSSNFLE